MSSEPKTILWANGTSSTVVLSWEVTGVQIQDEGPNKNAVVQTYWRQKATDEEGNEVSFEGATPFTSVNVPEGQFVPYEELTEEIVLGWIKQEAEVPHYRDHIYSVLASKLAEKLRVRHRPDRLPWQDPITPPTPPEPQTAPGVRPNAPGKFVPPTP